ncbi:MULTISPECIES: TniQ family protein [Ralstonia]|jgi:hypothetical protein|uniref:TniQ family protein n=3 Tax=Ralstonia TaxID=48736 RepID=A0A848P6F3_9RALS|nr:MULTISPECIES: TniQ family protein [Ralstonia]ENZ76346.1 hypothetical protein OR214_03512 [Ralstonia pickettii OR214]MBT2180924.1 TniQ family protein [Ralstonia pickettii]MCM3579045.1 TniQ family protein [Ralstonia pickettii]NMV41280.1 TniQ family protein [Ralstonia insidiosa]OYU24201.1 MAG: hypothetical protein CFE42_05250 [Ralstonia sp. PBBBR1]
MKTWSCAKTQLWPIRYKPIPGELLSSWIVRLAHGHGMGVMPFCNVALGPMALQLTMDIDRRSRESLLKALALHTGTHPDAVHQATLRVYEGVLYRQFHVGGFLPWVIAINLPRSVRLGPGLQFCPYCLRSDPVPYFRLSWRVALQTFCERHQCLLLDRCPGCGACLFVQRVDSNWCHAEIDGICHCHNCDFDLRLAEAPAVDDRGSGLLALLQQLTRELSVVNAIGLPGLLERLHAMAVTLLSGKAKPRLCNSLACRFGYADLEIQQARMPAFELQSVVTRHAVLLWSLWLLQRDPDAYERPVKPVAPLHHRFIKEILTQPRIDAGGQTGCDSFGDLSIAGESSAQIRDGRVVQLH